MRRRDARGETVNGLSDHYNLRLLTSFDKRRNTTGRFTSHTR